MAKLEYQLLSKLVEALGQGRGTRTLATLINQRVAFDDYFVLVFGKDISPIILSHGDKVLQKDETAFNATDQEAFKSNDEPFSKYVDKTYLLDPFYDLWRRGTEDGFFRLNDIAPNRFKASEYFLTHFNLYDLTDEGGFIFKIDDQYSMHFSLGRKSPRKNFIKRDCEILESMLPFVKSSMTQIFNRSKSDIQLHAETTAVFHKQLENKFLAFGKSILTKREIELVRLSLKGYSPKATGRLLDISTATVQSHIKNIYRKLEVGSHQELFGLFLEALGAKTDSNTQDPLTSFKV